METIDEFRARCDEAMRLAGKRIAEDCDRAFYLLTSAYMESGKSIEEAARLAVDAMNEAMQQPHSASDGQNP